MYLQNRISELYNEFKARGLDSLQLPTQNVALRSAFTGRTKRVKRQALVQLQIDNVSLDQIILISPQLVTPLLLGMDFCMDNHCYRFPQEDDSYKCRQRRKCDRSKLGK
jgi:hypothetical protein